MNAQRHFGSGRATSYRCLLGALVSPRWERNGSLFPYEVLSGEVANTLGERAVRMTVVAYLGFIFTGPPYLTRKRSGLRRDEASAHPRSARFASPRLG